MVLRLEYNEQEIRKLDDLIRSLPENLERRVWRAAYGEAAKEVARTARQPNYGFTDRTGRLRGSIGSGAVKTRFRRAHNIRLRYAGAVLAGSDNVRHAHLVESGHGGPKPARPHSFLERATRQSIVQARTAFIRKASQTVVRVIEQAKRKFGL